jgi:hypothetical protein
MLMTASLEFPIHFLKIYSITEVDRLVGSPNLGDMLCDTVILYSRSPGKNGTT